MRDGDVAAREELFTVVYGELRRLARRSMSNERREHTLQPTALVHEVFLRLMGNTDIGWENRAHFFAVAAQTMRRILVDHARTIHAQKRAGGRRIELSATLVLTEEKSADLLSLNETLDRLEAIDPRQCRVV
jgi:RNA polymerase sigma factor (TIGR02999 family)